MHHTIQRLLPVLEGEHLKWTWISWATPIALKGMP